MESQQELIDFLLLYFQMRNIHKWEWVGYKNIKALMTYITGIKDVETLRIIFEKMVKMGRFEKRKIKSCTDYKFVFNPTKEV
jgi:hypothetical protein